MNNTLKNSFIVIGVGTVMLLTAYLLVDTFIYITSLTTHDEVTKMIEKNNRYLLKTNEFKETVVDIIHYNNCEERTWICIS